jgi:hypothetical protein
MPALKTFWGRHLVDVQQGDLEAAKEQGLPNTSFSRDLNRQLYP